MTKDVLGLKPKLVKKLTICAETSSKCITRYNDSTKCTKFKKDCDLSSLSLCENLVDDLVRIKLITGKTKTPWRNMEGVKALKRTCRKFERKWRKTKLQVDYYM